MEVVIDKVNFMKFWGESFAPLNLRQFKDVVLRGYEAGHCEDEQWGTD